MMLWRKAISQICSVSANLCLNTSEDYTHVCNISLGRLSYSVYFARLQEANILVCFLSKRSALRVSKKSSEAVFVGV